MMEFALGYLGYTPDVFWKMTFVEYHAAANGYYKRIKSENIKQASLFRAVAYNVYRLGFMFSKKKPKSIDSFWYINQKTESDYESEKLERKKRYKKLPDKLPKVWQK